ncbi:hypothetical protein PCE1_001766 [Barthelona sp. PCE]
MEFPLPIPEKEIEQLDEGFSLVTTYKPKFSDDGTPTLAKQTALYNTYQRFYYTNPEVVRRSQLEWGFGTHSGLSAGAQVQFQPDVKINLRISQIMPSQVRVTCGTCGQAHYTHLCPRDIIEKRQQKQTFAASRAHKSYTSQFSLDEEKRTLRIAPLPEGFSRDEVMLRIFRPAINIFFNNPKYYRNHYPRHELINPRQYTDPEDIRRLYGYSKSNFIDKVTVPRKPDTREFREFAFMQFKSLQLAKDFEEIMTDIKMGPLIVNATFKQIRNR